MKATLIRVHKDLFQTFGRMILTEGNKFVTEYWCLEPADRDNVKDVSCIPEGEYVMQLTDKGYLVRNVPYRSGILVHTGNTVNDTEGCILLGRYFENVDNSLYLKKSKESVEEFTKLLEHKYVKLNIMKV